MHSGSPKQELPYSQLKLHDCCKITDLQA